jgi:DNA replication protein DnaD
MQDLNVNVDMSDIIAQATAAAKERALKQVNNYFSSAIDRAFSNGNSWGSSKGDAYKLVEQKAQAYLSSPEFASLITEIIEQKAKAAADNAVTIAMNHLARKMLFEKMD